jgi:hypothetical protein
MLNRMRAGERRTFVSLNERTSPSSAAVIAPAAGLTTRAAMMLKVSETE